MAERSLSDQEMVDILEDIARNGRNAAARIAAIKTLREIDAGVSPTSEAFEGLYEVANPGRKAKKAA